MPGKNLADVQAVFNEDTAYDEPVAQEQADDAPGSLRSCSDL